VTILGGTASLKLDGKLDTGADDSIFPAWVAAHIGLNLQQAPTGQATGLGSVSVPARYAQVRLRIARGGEQREWPAWVAFTHLPLGRPLLGFAGFLQFFTATFHGDREEAELTVNALYPGT
jgi:hypothetical protein